MRLCISMMQCYSLILALSFTTFAFAISSAQPAHAQDQKELPFDRFDLLNETSGWVLIDGHLFWTPDMGRTWTEIGPLIPASVHVEDVEFIDANIGWVLWSMAAPDGSSSFQLAHTADHGGTWTTHPLSLFDSGEVASFAEKAEMGWFDRQTGWISVKQATSSNFSVGTLFVTSDGGSTWSRTALPIADHIFFSDPQVGWAVGGPTNDQIFRTQDTGNTWQSMRLDNSPEDILVTAYMPFSSQGQGLLVTTNLGSENSLEIYSLDDTSEKWLPVNRVLLDVEPGVVGLSIFDSQNFVATIPGTGSIIRMLDGELHILDNKDNLSASIVDLDMVALDVGWAKSVASNCVSESSLDDQTASVSCSSSTRLLRTLDGGVTWQSVELPSSQSEAASAGILSSSHARETISFANAGNTQILIGQGFDKCEIPTLSQLQAWSGNSPYQAVNLYIGGSSRACENSALASSFLKQVHQQGWKFIPTWVGPQAPCTGYISRMSNDPATAFNQGIAEANLAIERLAALGLTYPDKTGSVVYYDIEPYGTNTSCRNAVNSFMNGWVSQLHVRGNLAGVYGSTLCNTALSDFMNITNVPDVIWPARWYHNLGSGYYNPDASVWDLGGCIPNTAWSNHQRIRQYEGDHNESWGNLPLRIDSNVLDGVVAIPYGFFVSSISRADASPTNAASVVFTVSFLEPVTGVDVSDLVLSTTGLTDAAITDLSGSGNTYTVTIDTGSGNGSIRLDLTDDDSIRNASNNPLGGTGAGNGNYTNGKPYTIIKTPTFGDVPVSHWAWPYIERLYAAGTTGGCSFNPLNYCSTVIATRAQMAVFLERGIHGPSYTPPAVGGSTGFGDVPPSYWAAAWIKQLVTEGITAGCGGGNYCPEMPVTRAQMAVFLLRAKYGPSYTPPAVGGSTGFGDVPPSYWAAAWIKQLVTEGITAGCGNGNYCPELPVTRDQMAVFLVRTFRLP
jgi:photosystem II stability/assembly factor-like uncharacterized protein